MKRALAAFLAAFFFGPQAYALPPSAGAAAARKVGGPQWDFHFQTNALPAFITFTRASTKTDLLYTATSTSYNTYANNVPVINAVNGLLYDEGRTNYLLNSTAPATQTVTLPTVAGNTYTLWMIGTGSVTTAAGTATGSNFGTASQGSPNIFTITGAGTVTVTVSGTVGVFQLEQGPGPSSFIPTTSATVARSPEVFYVQGTLIGPYGGTFATTVLLNSGGYNRTDNHVACTTGGATPFAPFNNNNLTPGQVVTDSGGSITFPTYMSFGAVHSEASTWGQRGLSLTFDGLPVAYSNNYLATATYQWPLTCSIFASNSVSELGSAWIRRMRFWNYQLSPEMVLQLSNGR